jgi:hypothetical protein
MCVPENEMETLKRSTNQLAQGTVFEVGETKSGSSEVTDLPKVMQTLESNYHSKGDVVTV